MQTHIQHLFKTCLQPKSKIWPQPITASICSVYWGLVWFLSNKIINFYIYCQSVKMHDLFKKIISCGGKFVLLQYQTFVSSEFHLVYIQGYQTKAQIKCNWLQPFFRVFKRTCLLAVEFVVGCS